MQLGLLNLSRIVQPIFGQVLRSAFNEISHEFMQDRLRETRSRSRAMTKLNTKNFDSESRRTEYMSERNLITERIKPGVSGFGLVDLADAMSLPDNAIQVNTDRETVVHNLEMAKSQPIPKLGLKNSLVTRTHDNGRI